MSVAFAATPEPAKVPPLPALLPKPVAAKAVNDRFRLTERTRVVALDVALLDEATLLAEELSRNLGWKVAAEATQRMNPGDIILGLDPSLKPEGYRMRLTGTRALIAGGADVGVFRATRTLLQLFPAELLAATKPAKAPEWSAACGEFEDQPTLRWRILDVDTGFFHKPKEVLLRDLDQMAQHKINVLRWLLNAEGNWRLPVDKHPELAEAIKGAPRSYEEERPALRGDELALYQSGRPHGGAYTEAEIKEVIAYAQARHIEVIPRVRLDFALEPEDRALQADVLDTLARLFPGEFIQVDVVDHPRLPEKLAGPGFKKVLTDESLAGAEAARVWLQGELVKQATARKKRLLTRLWGSTAEELIRPGTPKGAIIDLLAPGRATQEGTTKALAEFIKLGHAVVVSGVLDADGEPVLNITGQVFGGLTTLKSFENFHLRTQHRWGTRKWEPRLNAVRDNGILFHCVGEHGAGGKNWMRSQECQVQEGDIGDWWPIAGAMVDAAVKDEDGKVVRYVPGAPLRAMRSRIWHGTDYPEKPSGEWNTVEVYAFAGDAVFRLNGRTVNVIRNSRYREKGSEQEIPLRAGKLQIQSEAAECQYRRLEIRPLGAWPQDVLADVPAAK